MCSYVRYLASQQKPSELFFSSAGPSPWTKLRVAFITRSVLTCSSIGYVYTTERTFRRLVKPARHFVIVCGVRLVCTDTWFENGWPRQVSGASEREVNERAYNEPVFNQSRLYPVVHIVCCLRRGVGLTSPLQYVCHIYTFQVNRMSVLYLTLVRINFNVVQIHIIN